mgnify:CR=1 FL=1
MLDIELSLTAKLIYSILLERAFLSKKNGWIDESGRVFVTFPIAHIAATTHKGITAVKDALHELDSAGLIERKRNFSAPNTIYVLLPDSRETVQTSAGKPAPSNKNTNNKSSSNKKRVELARQSYGSYGNVFLTDAEYQKLSVDIPYLDNLIEQLSAYMESSGKKYKSHAATLRVWAARDRNQQKPRSSGMPDYSFKEGESL